MRGRASMVLPLLSLLLCVALLALWARSYLVMDQVERWSLHPTPGGADSGESWALSTRGRVAIRLTRVKLDAAAANRVAPMILPGVRWRRAPAQDWETRSIFQHESTMIVGLGLKGIVTTISFPLSVAVLLTAAAPAFSAFGYRRRRRRNRQRLGLCAACGYNLTANTSGVCPECGTVLKVGGMGHAQ
jgi:hypothetical protein